jgi:hypothetical protein
VIGGKNSWTLLFLQVSGEYKGWPYYRAFFTWCDRREEQSDFTILTGLQKILGLAFTTELSLPGIREKE